MNGINGHSENGRDLVYVLYNERGPYSVASSLPLLVEMEQYSYIKRLYTTSLTGDEWSLQMEESGTVGTIKLVEWLG